uniref:F-box domain-containing protein n=1 Tax=Pectinophora gossypiella TaxID=13191 RepID=A0A1E1VXQ2_PECGO
MTQDYLLSLPYSLPTEILLYILTYLPAKHLVRCRQVCVRWRNIIDWLTTSDSLWREHCKRDFSDVHMIARHKARVGMLWFNIYRSLSLWPQLSLARDVHDEFASASCLNDEIQSLEVLKNGIIGVHKFGSIVYYDIETLEPAKRGPITGEYVSYSENDNAIILKTHNLHLFVIRKLIHNPHFESNATFHEVKTYILVDKLLYYVDLNNDIYLCKLDEANLVNKLVKESEEFIMCLGYTDRLNVLTFRRNIYSMIDGNLVLVCDLDECYNLLHQFYKYNLLETVDWRIVFQWTCIMHHKLPEGPLREIMTVRIYGDVVLVGCNWGVFLIYYAPFTNGEFDLYKTVPVRQYNFMEPSDCPVLIVCPILRADILEAEDGHTIILAMPKKVAVLDFVHDFKRTESVAVLPYNDLQQVKLLRTAEVDNNTS